MAPIVYAIIVICTRGFRKDSYLRKDQIQSLVKIDWLNMKKSIIIWPQFCPKSSKSCDFGGNWGFLNRFFHNQLANLRQTQDLVFPLVSLTSVWISKQTDQRKERQLCFIFNFYNDFRFRNISKNAPNQLSNSVMTIRPTKSINISIKSISNLIVYAASNGMKAVMTIWI